MVPFTIKQCTYFVAVAEHGGIAQASRALNLSQPAIAQALDKFERLTGLRLFHRRHARGLELTAQGRAFIGPVRAFLAQAERLDHRAAAISADHSGIIRLGCFHTIAPFCLARLVKGYRGLHPEVTVIVSEERQDGLVSGLAGGSLDLALTYDMALDAAALDWQVLARLAPRIILSADHRLAERPCLSLSELTAEPFVLFEGAGSRDYFRSILERHGLDPPVAFVSDSIASVRSAVGKGLGFSFTVLRPHSDETFDGGRVVTIPITEDIPPMSIVLAHARDRERSALVGNFADYCRSQIEAMLTSA